MISDAQLAELFGRTEIFEKLQSDYHKAIAKETELRTYASGEWVVKQGERGEELFLVVSGAVNVLVEDYALRTEQVVLELNPGQSFGETALLTNERRSASVRAKEETTCAVLSRLKFERILERLPEVSMAVSRYLARRLSAQCKLTGFRYASLDQLVFEPRLYKAFSESVLRRCQAIPLELKSRTIRIATTRPTDLEVIKALQREVPGFGLEPIACTQEDYLSFLHRYRRGERAGVVNRDGEKLKVKRADGSSVGDPLRSVLGELIQNEKTQLVLDCHQQMVELLVRKSGFLEPLQPVMTGPGAEGLIYQVDELLQPEGEEAAIRTQSLSIDGRDCQLSISRLRGRTRSRYSLELTDVQSAVPPLRSMFPSESTLNLVRRSVMDPGRITFLTGAKDSGLSTTLYSLLEHRGESLDPRNVLLFETKPLIPQNQIVQVQLGRSLDPTLSVASAQRPELMAFDQLMGDQVKELLLHPDSDSAVIATYQGDDLLDVLASAAKSDGGRSPSLHRVGLVLRQRLVRRVCSNCCEKYEPVVEELQKLKESGLDNEQGSYYQGAGCEECGQTGVKGQVPLFEAIHCNKALLEGLAGVRSREEDKLRALRSAFAFSYRDFARLLISRGMIDPIEGLRLFPPHTP